jgi:hypothetical protein
MVLFNKRSVLILLFFYDLGWAAGANPLEDPPLVIMVAFDRYQGPAFLTEEGEELRDQAGPDLACTA